MTFSDTFAPSLSSWTANLAGRGITVLPPSAAVPVELHAALSDGRGLHFRCRGTQVRMRVFAAEDVRLAVPARALAPTELPLTTERWVPLAEVEAAGALDVARARVVFTGTPQAVAAIDGAQRYGWRGYEAGLLRIGQAAALFDELLGALVPPDTEQSDPVARPVTASRSAGVPPAGTVAGAGAAPGRDGSAVRS